ncbi:uncharacterized protein LOC129240232 [Anastrepha obliqua]|uniref:uncharacterized protein LOC129240232 n=1 Tax=Anastrepha obliqua TaxID=95512 RepID=UPI00240901D6|nr:uncharacterized protein LOC129240232 [Anastrepha obliqua]
MERCLAVALGRYRCCLVAWLLGCSVAGGVEESAQRLCSGYTKNSTKEDMPKLSKAAVVKKFGSSFALGLKNHLKNKDGSNRANADQAATATRTKSLSISF